MKTRIKNKIQGFTLVELITVIVILGVVITIGFNAILSSIELSKEKMYNEQINRIVELSKNWAIENIEKLPHEKEAIYVTVQELKDNNLLTGQIINPKDESEMNGCIKISNDNLDDIYTYSYLESNNCPNENTIYNITYNLDGGILDNPNPSTYTVNTKTFTLNNPTKTGYYFVGWQLNGTEEIKETTKIYKGSTGDREYTAIWEMRAYNLTINPNGGIYDGSPEIVTILKAINSNVEILTPTREGYEFTGWTVNAEQGELNEEQDIFTVGNSDATLIANWTPIQYTITYNLDGGNSNNPSTYTIETETFNLTNPTRAGYEFVGWTGSNGTEPSTNVTISKGTMGDKEYTAIYDKELVYIEVDPNGGTYAGSPEIYGFYVRRYDKIKLIPPTRDNYYFDGFEANVDDFTTNDDGTITVGMTDIKFTAKWNNCIIASGNSFYEYDGNSEYIGEGDGKYRIRFLTSGNLTLNCPTIIDAFLVGGGASGGGSGKTETYRNILLEPGKSYYIEIGNGGEVGKNGYPTIAFGKEVEGGNGCNGGSGCGSSGYTGSGSNGASDGQNAAGTGQKSTTREFGEPNGELYAGGGGGGTGACFGHCPESGCNLNGQCYNGKFDGGKGGAGGGGNGAGKNNGDCKNGEPNTGGGAGLGVRGALSCSGGSGIVVIRNIICKGNEKYCYTGESEYIDEGDGNWKIKLLSTGTLKIYDSSNIDVFLVGGGSSGGGSGHTFTKKGYSVIGGTEYEVTIGYGGIPGQDGTATTIFGFNAEPGEGCNGGSGCGSSGYTGSGSNGASDGQYAAGTGQKSTTREFGEPNGKLYAGGGGGGTGACYGHCPESGCNLNGQCYNGIFDGGKGGAGGGGNGAGNNNGNCENGEPNTGGGAGLGVRGTSSCYGGSGIVVIRNAQ